MTKEIKWGFHENVGQLCCKAGIKAFAIFADPPSLSSKRLLKGHCLHISFISCCLSHLIDYFYHLIDVAFVIYFMLLVPFIQMYETQIIFLLHLGVLCNNIYTVSNITQNLTHLKGYNAK